MAQIINDDVVINYRNNDKNECIHFLTHIDAENGPAPDASYYISLTAKTIFTSHYNAWFLKTHYNCENVRPWEINTMATLQVKGTKYTFTFLDAKHCLGSVSILLIGDCGAILYTGNFSYYSNFCRSLMSCLFDRKILLKCLYMDGTFYEQDSNFLGIDENIELATALMRYTNVRMFLYIDSIHLYPILAELALRLQEKLCISTSKSMKFLKMCGYGNLFTAQEKGSRITVLEELVQTNNSKGLVVFFHRSAHKENNEFSKYKVDSQTSAHHFYFYGNSNHADCCRLLNEFVPEKLIHLNQSLIDSSKVKYHLVNINKLAIPSTSYSTSDKKIQAVYKNDLQIFSKLGIGNPGDHTLQDNGTFKENVCNLTSESTNENAKKSFYEIDRSSEVPVEVQYNSHIPSYNVNKFFSSNMNYRKIYKNNDQITPKKNRHYKTIESSNFTNHSNVSRVETGNFTQTIYLDSHDKQRLYEDNTCDSGSKEKRLNIGMYSKEIRTYKKTDKTCLLKSILENKYDKSSINYSEYITDKRSNLFFCEQNSNSPNLTANKGLFMEQSKDAVKHSQQFEGNNHLDSVSHESNDNSEIMVCSGDETEKEVKAEEKSLKGTIRVRKFDDSFFYKPVSSNNSSKAILNLNKTNEMSLVSNNNSTVNVPQMLKDSLSDKKVITTQIQEYKKMVRQYKTYRPILPKNRKQPKKVIGSDNTEACIRDKTPEDPLCTREFNDKVENCNKISGTKLIANQEHTVSTLLNPSFTISSSVQVMNKSDRKHQINNSPKGNKSLILRKPRIVEHVINVKKVDKVPPRILRKMICRTMAIKSLGVRNEISSLTDSGANISKKIEGNSVLSQQKSAGSQSQETVNGSKSCVSISEQNEMYKCSNNIDIRSKPSLSKEIENSESNLMIVPKQLQCSQNLIETSNSTIDNVDNFNSADKICTIDSTKQNDIASSATSPLSENREIVNSSDLVGQSQPTKIINQSNDFETNGNFNSEKLAVEDDREDDRDSLVCAKESIKLKRTNLDVNTIEVGETIALTTRSKSFIDNPTPIDLEMRIRQNITPCTVVVNTKSISKKYFYSPVSNCYLPGFFGFHKSNIRPRKELNALRMLKQKLGKMK